MTLDELLRQISILLLAVASVTIHPPNPYLTPSERPNLRVDNRPKIVYIRQSAWQRDPEISWYGPGFYGNRTACGLRLTRELVGVAHRTLPCGTLIEFRNGKNTVITPVVDRGPYTQGRQFDLTRAACRALSHCFTGSIEWRRVDGR